MAGGSGENERRAADELPDCDPFADGLPASDLPAERRPLEIIEDELPPSPRVDPQAAERDLIAEARAERLQRELQQEYLYKRARRRADIAGVIGLVLGAVASFAVAQGGWFATPLYAVHAGAALWVVVRLRWGTSAAMVLLGLGVVALGFLFAPSHGVGPFAIAVWLAYLAIAWLVTFAHEARL
ncbi:MAG: hypothetical protein ACOCZK_07315 [Planctomycetota bacterium]